MNFFRLSLISAAALMLAVPTFADSYRGGFEDLSGKGSDYDYNDVIFTLSGNGLTLHTTDGKWYNPPASLNTPGTPFWNNASLDNGNKNIGYCMYGGGDCGAGLDQNAQYLASSVSSRKTANNVYFSGDYLNKVNTRIDMQITVATDELFYYYTSNPDVLMPLMSTDPNNMYFYAMADFGIAGVNKTTGNVYYSQTVFDSLNDPNAHFAFFSDAATAPEPGAMGLMAGGLVAIGALFRRKVKA